MEITLEQLLSLNKLDRDLYSFCELNKNYCNSIEVFVLKLKIFIIYFMEEELVTYIDIYDIVTIK